MTINSEQVLNYMKAHYGEELTKQDIVEALGISLPAVTGSINGLVKRGFVTERIEEIEVEPATDTRKAKIKTVRHETLTEAAEEAEKLAAKEAAKAARAAEKAAAKNA